MGNELRLRIYFPPGGELACLEREREKAVHNAENVAKHYANVVKELDERIAELKTKETTYEQAI